MDSTRQILFGNGFIVERQMPNAKRKIHTSPFNELLSDFHNLTESLLSVESVLNPK